MVGQRDRRGCEFSFGHSLIFDSLLELLKVLVPLLQSQLIVGLQAEVGEQFLSVSFQFLDLAVAFLDGNLVAVSLTDSGLMFLSPLVKLANQGRCLVGIDCRAVDSMMLTPEVAASLATAVLDLAEQVV